MHDAVSRNLQTAGGDRPSRVSRIAARLKENYATLDPDTDVHSLHRGDITELNLRSEAIFTDAKLLLEKANFRASCRAARSTRR